MPVGSIKETFEPSKADIEIGEMPKTQSNSQEALRENAEQPGEAGSSLGESPQWPRVSMLLESERPFARFEEFEGRQRV